MGNLAALALVGQMTFSQLAVVDEAWTARFSPRDGWAGGDAAYSTRLADGRVLWLFADSFAGDVKNGSRAGGRFLNNTAAIQTDANAKLSFFVAKNDKGEPATWITPEDGRRWFWPAAPVATKRGVVICLWRIERAQGDPGFAFKQVGCDLAIVDDTSGDPADWKLALRTLPFCATDENGSVSFGSAAVVHDGFAYIYGVRERKGVGALPDKHAILARVAVDEIAAPDRWRFFAGFDDAKAARWSESIEDLAVVAKDVPNECSVGWDAPRKRWIFVGHEWLLGSHVCVRTAPELAGPWSDPIKVYKCPEPETDKRMFVYAGKGHHEIDLGSPDELLVTYATNSREFAHLIGDASVYVPKAIRLRLDEVK